MAILRIERLAWILAAVCLISGTGLAVSGKVVQTRRVAAFVEARAELAAVVPDQSDWSTARRAAWQRQLASNAAAAATAILRIPDLEIEAEIFPTTSDRHLDLGVGRIERTSAPGEPGNIGLAGHRDGYFRRLKDIRQGQDIEVLTIDRRWVYRVAHTRVVSPDAVEVLTDTGDPVLTLVTCYPFHFLGTAPRRFVVRAVLIDQSSRAQSTKEVLL
jgi:sortase A